jgi:uncharacterized protein
MELMQALRRLAQVDDEWDEKARRFQQVRERLSNNTTLQEMRSEQQARESQLSSLRGELRDQELELEGLQERSRQVEESLYGGSIMVPRELENLRRDSEFLKRRASQLEDQILDLMATVEELTVVVEQGSQEQATFEKQWSQETATARDEYVTLRARLEELKAERDELRASIPQRELALYNELRRSKGGRPLAPMVDGVCQICHVAVPARKAAIALGGRETVATCEGCGRILYQA